MHSACATPYFFAQAAEKCTLLDQLRTARLFVRSKNWSCTTVTNFWSFTYLSRFSVSIAFLVCRLESFRPGFAVIVRQYTLQIKKKTAHRIHAYLSPSAPRAFHTRISSASSSSILIVRPAHLPRSSQKSPISLDSYAQLALLTSVGLTLA